MIFLLINTINSKIKFLKIKKVYVYNKLPNGWAYVEYHGVKGYMIIAELIFL